MTELYERSKAAEVGLGPDQFAAILNEICAKHAAGGEPRNIAEFHATFRLEEIVLAWACAAGNEVALEIFLVCYREKLYDIAGYITKEASALRDFLPRNVSSWPHTTLMSVRWRKLRACSACMNPPSAASWINWRNR